MRPNPVYRVTSMEAFDMNFIYSHEIILRPIPEDEAIDLANGTVSQSGYERKDEIHMHVSEEVFHSLRIGMLYQPAFSPANLVTEEAA